MLTMVLCLVTLQPTSATSDVGAFVRALWLMQAFGTAEAVIPSNDVRLKSLLAKAIAKDGEIKFSEIEGFMRADVFNKISHGDGKIDDSEMKAALDQSIPVSRNKLYTKVREHADLLTTTFDMISEPHRKPSTKLANWLFNNYQPGKPLHVMVICTGNSRRSILAASMGNLAAAYYGMPEVHFFSGGTAPTAFNPRTVAALQAIGFDIEKTTEEAPRGEPKTLNPIYRVSWGEGYQTREFSKHYADKSNPQSGFAALMVCSEADEGCPLVNGSATRVSMPFLDPKIYDGSSLETSKYAERRDDIGRQLLSVMAQVRQRINEVESTRAERVQGN